MKIYLDCIPCFIQQALRAGRMATSDEKNQNILYIGDNAGESVFDKLLIKELKRPVKYAVRSIPIINDVTIEEGSIILKEHKI
jgi:uncharacterized protein with ATP-grasp and redox domains